MTVTRQEVDIDYVVAALLSGDTLANIAKREAARLGRPVSRGLISGIERDIKAGKFKPSTASRTQERWIPTYVYGEEQDNGGIPVFTGYLEFEGDAVVISDLHIPFTDFEFAETPKQVGQYYGIKRLIIAGDLLDGNTQNSFKHKVRKPAFSSELKLARELLEFYAEWFDEIVFEPGNHDDWFMQNHEGNLFIDDIAMLLQSDTVRERLIVTAYDRVTLISGYEKWLIPHQADFSRYSLAVGNNLAKKFLANIIVPHQHNSAIGFDDYHRFVVIDIGGLHDAEKMEYLALKTTSKPEPDQGFAVIIDGRGELWTPDPRITDWSKIRNA